MRWPLISWICALGLLMPLGAFSADKAERMATDPASKKAKAKNKAAGSKLVMPGGSGESASERSARLRRECKGRPNAGACTGYTD